MRHRAALFAYVIAGAASAGEVNVAPSSTVLSTPYVGAPIRYLTDGRVVAGDDGTLMLGAPLPVRTGHQMPVQYEFVFPHALPVTRVRLFQHPSTQGRMPAVRYAIELDRHGTGAYETVVAESNGRGGQWTTHEMPAPVVAHALRFRTNEYPRVAGPNYGGAPLGEVEIYTPAIVFPPAPGRAAGQAPLLQVDRSRARRFATDGRGIETRDASRTFLRGVFGSMWMHWSPGTRYNEGDNATKIALLQQLHVNRYWLYPNGYVSKPLQQPYVTLPTDVDYRYYVDRQVQAADKDVRIVPFPSRVVPGHADNALTPLVAHMNRAGIRVIANQSLLPFGIKSWDFPRVIDASVYPSVLASTFVREASTALYREFLDAGVDGLALGGDEFFLHGTSDDAGAPPVCRDAHGRMRDICQPTPRSLFFDRYGVDYPSARAPFDSSAGRRTVFEYEQLAKLFSGHARMMKGARADAIVTSLFRPGEEMRPAYRVAYDVLGSVGMIDEMSSDPYWGNDSHLGHYYFANEAKRLAAASRTRTAVLTLQTTPGFDKRGYRDPLMVYGPAFSALMHGAKGINFYKIDYLFSDDRHAPGPWVQKFFALTRHLEALGLADHQSPKTVALLYSRSSEDWTLLANRGNPIAAAEATLYHGAVMEVLFRNGIPFDVYYLDRPETLDRLAEYEAVVLPFAYSVGRDAASRIRQAAGQGVPVVAIARRGEVDEYGAVHPTPVLAGIAAEPGAPIDVVRTNYERFSTAVLAALRKALRRDPTVVGQAVTTDVECSLREHRTSRLLFCLNWEAHDVEVELRLALDHGAYRASVITLEDEAPASIGGAEEPASSQFARFRLALGPGEAKVLRIVRAAP